MNQCSEDKEELPLSGGRVTSGVVRIGETVRRPTGAHSPFVRTLLHRLERAGFQSAPRYLGTNAQGRDTFSFLEGQVPRDLGWWEDARLAEAATLIRRFHDATAGSALAGGAEVVCHHDLSPCNFVFIDTMPRAIIDFDAARPGSRLFDLGYAAWLWLDIGNEAITAREQLRRLSLFASAYGHRAEPSLLDAIELRQRLLRDDGNARGQTSLAVWAAHCLTWTQTALR